MTYDELLAKYNEANQELINAQKDLKKYKAELSNAKVELDNAKVELDNAKLELNTLKRIIFGSKRERVPNEEIVDIDQTSLFDNEEDIEKNLQEQIAEKVEEIIVYRKKKSKKRVTGIKKSYLKNVTIERKEYPLNKEEQFCEECGSDLTKVGTKVVRQEIEFVPAVLKLVEYVQYIYKCTKCGTDESEKDTPTFVKSETPRPLLAHSFASPSLAAEVMYQKYYLGVPLARQEKMWDDKNLILPRNMMANWCIKINEYYLEALWKIMMKQLKEKNELLHCDETKIQVNKEPGRKPTSNSYMWVMRSGDLEKKKGIVYQYSPSRSAETAKEFLKGFKGILVTDGYSSYNNLEVAKHAECFSHARRYFYEAVPLMPNKDMDTSSESYKGVEYCKELFKIESKIAKLSVQEKLKVRQKESKPVLDAFFVWVNDTLNNKIISNQKFNKALTYASNQQKELSTFITDGRIPIENNAVERAIRPFAVHRKSWLFADSVAGANTNATMYSLIESAKINKLNIYKYINYLLEELPQLDALDEYHLDKYLPWSEELPAEIRNFEGEYKDLKLPE